jgi:hypothetical protein
MNIHGTYETVSINYAYYLWINGFFTGIALCILLYLFIYTMARKTRVLKLPIEIGKICEGIDKIRTIIEPVISDIYIAICKQYEEYKDEKQHNTSTVLLLSKLLNLFTNVPQHA